MVMARVSLFVSNFKEKPLEFRPLPGTLPSVFIVVGRPFVSGTEFSLPVFAVILKKFTVLRCLRSLSFEDPGHVLDGLVELLHLLGRKPTPQRTVFLQP